MNSTTAFFLRFIVCYFLIFGGVQAWQFKNSVPSHIADLCAQVESQVHAYSDDLVLDSLSGEFKQLKTCQDGFELWFWEIVEPEELQKLNRINSDSLSQIKEIKSSEDDILCGITIAFLNLSAIWNRMYKWCVKPRRQAQAPNANDGQSADELALRLRHAEGQKEALERLLAEAYRDHEVQQKSHEEKLEEAESQSRNLEEKLIEANADVRYWNGMCDKLMRLLQPDRRHPRVIHVEDKSAEEELHIQQKEKRQFLKLCGSMMKRLKAELKLIQLNDRFEAQAKNFEEQLRLKDEQLAKFAQRNEQLMAKLEAILRKQYPEQ